MNYKLYGITKKLKEFKFKQNLLVGFLKDGEALKK